MSILEIEQEIIDEFAFMEDWMDKYNHIIQMAKDLPLLPESEKNDNLIIKGCQSKVWVKVDLVNDVLDIKADSDAIITKGLIALIVRVFNKRKPEEIIQANLQFIDEIGLKQHLSPTRSNGLLAMIKQIKLYAIGYQSKR
jgi:cysteine desulfuration protein SufE